MLKETDFEATKETKNLNIQGTLKLFHVVKIPLNELKYNRLNDRIATWISEYENEHGDGEFPENREEFNSIIEDFIYNSNTKQLNKTKTSIKNFDQMEAAVVLSNGIIVDGNRRFTALRKLARDGEGQKFNYLKAVIIPNEQYTSKEIKTMELNLQHAKENPVDYDPIDNLVGIYRELVGPEKQYNPKEYAHEVDEKESVIKKYMAVSQLMVDYLEYIHRPKQFYIARQQKLNGPLNEIYLILKSKKIDPEDLNDVKDTLFASMLVLDGDVTRRVRDLRKVVEDKHSLDLLMGDIDEDLDRVEDSFDNADEEFNESDEREIKKTVEVPDDIRKSLSDKIENQINRKRIDDAQNVPIAKLNQSFNYISDVNPSAVSRMDEKDTDTIKKLLNQIDQQVKAIKEVL